jgi:hypothetical protein
MAEIVAAALIDSGETGTPNSVLDTARASDTVSGVRQWELINTGVVEGWQLIDTLN